MKKLLYYFSLVAFVACNNDPKVESMSATGSDSAAKKENMPAVTYPYEIGYSAQFEIGDVEQSKKILDIWKDFDNGDVTVHKDYFADSIELHFPDGSMMHNVKDSVLAVTNSWRKGYSEVKSYVDAIIPLRSIDKKENWVTVWGKEVHTMKGKTDSVDLQETWRFNKDGKIDFLLQYKRDYAAKK
jgi:hypothetical protein